LKAELFTGSKGLLPAPVPRALSTREVGGEGRVFAYVHALACTEDDVLIALRKACPAAFILDPGGQIGPTRTARSQGEHWPATAAPTSPTPTS